MVIDTSAMLAILQDEPERGAFAEKIAAAAVCRISAASFVEASMVLESRHGAEGVRLLDLLIESAGVEVVSVWLKPGSRVRPLPTSGRGATRPHSTTETALSTRLPASSANRCSARARTSR